MCILNAVQYATLCANPRSEVWWVICREIMGSKTPDYVFEVMCGTKGLLTTPDSAADLLNGLEGHATPLPISGLHSSFDFAPIPSGDSGDSVTSGVGDREAGGVVSSGRASSCGSECSTDTVGPGVAVNALLSKATMA